MENGTNADPAATPPSADNGSGNRTLVIIGVVIIVLLLVIAGILLTRKSDTTVASGTASSSTTSTTTATGASSTTSTATGDNNGGGNSGGGGGGNGGGGNTPTTKTNTPSGPAPVIVTFTTPENIDCHNGNSQTFSASWTTTGATKTTISIDGPGVYKTYGANGSESLPFNCSSSHTFLLTAYGADGKTATKSITLQPRNVQGSGGTTP